MKTALALSKRPIDVMLGMFFLLHLPIMLLLDAQVVFPKAWFPTVCQQLLQWHVKQSGDYLVGNPPHFFKAMVYAEFLIQLPLHIANAYGFLLGKDWGRMTGIIYGVHTATTMIPILGDIWASGVPTRSALLAIYIPYLLIPLIVVARVLPYAHPFAAPSVSFEDKTR